MVLYSPLASVSCKMIEFVPKKFLRCQQRWWEEHVLENSIALNTVTPLYVDSLLEMTLFVIACTR